MGKVQNAMVVGHGTKCKTLFRSPRIIIDVFDDMAIMMIKKRNKICGYSHFLYFFNK